MLVIDVAKGICAMYRDNMGEEIDAIRLQQYLYIAQMEMYKDLTMQKI